MGVISWLKFHLEKDDIPGLKWNGKDTFRVDWAHCGNQNWSQVKSQVFIQYAQYRNQTKKTDLMSFTKKEVEVYKRNFRATLNKYKTIVKVSEGKGTDPHRIYRFKCKPESNVRPSRVPEDRASEEIQVGVELPCWSTLGISSFHSDISDSGTSQPHQHSETTSIEDTSYLGEPDRVHLQSENNTGSVQYHVEVSNKEPCTQKDSIKTAFHYESHVLGKHSSSDDWTCALNAVVTNGFGINARTSDINNQTPFCFPTKYSPDDSSTTLGVEGTNHPPCYQAISENGNQSQTYIPKLVNSADFHPLGRTPDIIKSADVETDSKEQRNSMSESSLELPSELLDYDSNTNGFDKDVALDIMNETVCLLEASFPLANITTGQDMNMENGNNDYDHAKSSTNDKHMLGANGHPHQFQSACSSALHNCNENGIMNIDVIARNKIISSHHIENPNGCMILNSTETLKNPSNADAEQCFGQDYKNKDKIILDVWNKVLPQLLELDQTSSCRRAETIGSNLCRPLVLFVQNGDIKLERHCTAKVQTVLKSTNEVPENVTRFDKARYPKTIFSASNYFQPALKLYENNDVLTPEPCTGVYVIIGQHSTKFRDDFAKILLMLHVTSCQAHRVLQRLKEEKSKSLSLAYSLPNEVDQLMEKTKEMSI